MGGTETGIGFRLNRFKNTLAVMSLKMLELLGLYLFSSISKSKGIISVANELVLEMDFPTGVWKSIEL